MTYDQFILSNHSDYSGSYTDYVNVKTTVKNTNIANGVLLDQITHSWDDGVARSPNVYYTFNDSLNDSSGNGYHLTLFTGSKGTTATYDGDDIKPGVKSYGFNNTILSASGLFKNVFNGNSKTYTIEFLMKPKSRIPETFVDNGVSGAPSSSWSGTGFTGVGSMYLEQNYDLKFNYDANSRGLFGIHSSGSSTHGTLSDHSTFYPKSIICYGHDLIEHGTNVSPSSLHGSRTTGIVYDDGDAKELAGSGIYQSSDGRSTTSNLDFDSKRPQNYLLNEWQYVVITRDSNSYKIYINGELMDEIYGKNVEDSAYAPYQSLTFGINPEVLWRIQAIQDDVARRSASNPTYAQPWFPNTNKGWPHILKNLTDDAQTIAVWGEISGLGPIYKSVPGYPIGGPPSSSFIDTLCWTGSLAHWKLYQGAALGSQAIKTAYEKIFVPSFSTETIQLGLKTNSNKEKFIYDSYSSAYKTTLFTALPGTKKTVSRELSSLVDFTDGTKNVMLSEIIDAVSGSSVGKNQNFNNFEDENEIIYDSLVASPVEYHLLNGAQPILLESGSRISNSGFNNLTYSKNTAFALPIVGKGVPSTFLSQTPTAGIQSNKVVSGSETLTVGDNLWSYFFPFEQKYKSLIRLKLPSNKLPTNYTIKLGESGSVAVLPWTFNSVTDGGYVRSNSDSVLNQPVKTNIFSGILFRLGGIDDPAGINESNNIENTATICVSDFTLNDTKQFMQQGNLTGLVNSSVFNKKIIMAPRLIDTYKTYFGVGRKYNIRYPGVGIGSITDTPDATTVASSRSTGSYNLDGGPGYLGITGPSIFTGFKATANFINSSLYVMGTKVEGWKYGLYSALPTKNTTVFRRDHYGQFRDMLEQRLFTKFSLVSNNTITNSPINIRFITDSDASVTSSLGLDTNSSGIYDYEYASGKPFIERD